MYSDILEYIKLPFLVAFDCIAFFYLKMTESGFKSSEPKGKTRKRKSPSDSGSKSSTVIERTVISPNWQNFLQNQKKMDKKPKEDRPKTVEKEISAYWKAKRLEKKANSDATSPSCPKASREQEALGELIEKPSNIEEIIKNNSYWKNKRLQKKNGGVTAKPAGNSSEVTGSGIDLNLNPAPVLDKKPTVTKFVSMDCEMVGIGATGRDSMLARVSLVNKFGDCIYDKFVKPREKVVDYRTPVSGIRREDIESGESFDVVQKEVADILRNRFLVGHALKKDLDVLYLSHPKRKIRDTSKYKPFRRVTLGNTPSLKRLTQELLGASIQEGEHSSVEDARAAMRLYSAHSGQWEATLAARDRKNN